MHVEVFYRMHLTCGPVDLCLFCTEVHALPPFYIIGPGSMGGCRLTDFVHLWSKSYAASIAGDSHQDLHELK